MNVPPSRLHIAVAEDDPVIRKMLENYLDSDDITLRISENGQKLLQDIQNFQPDLILLDVIMPDMDGLQTLEHLKLNPHWQNIPVIIISSRADIPTLSQALENGADDFLPKPFTKRKLLGKIAFHRLPLEEKKAVSRMDFLEQEDLPDVEKRRILLKNIEYIYLFLLSLITHKKFSELLLLGGRLLNHASRLKLFDIKGKIVQMLASAKNEDSESAALYLEEIYLYLRDLESRTNIS